MTSRAVAGHIKVGIEIGRRGFGFAIVDVVVNGESKRLTFYHDQNEQIERYVSTHIQYIFPNESFLFEIVHSDAPAFSTAVTDTPLLRGYMIDLLMPADRADDVISNLLERHDYWAEKYGPVRARRIFAMQSFGTILTFWADWVVRRVRLMRFLRAS